MSRNLDSLSHQSSSPARHACATEARRRAGPGQSMTDKPPPSARRTAAVRADRDRHERPHWTIDALAIRWAVSTRTVRRLIESGQLRAIRIGGQLRVSPEALERFEERQEVRARSTSGVSAFGKS
jgi:excisionase family DNA binding protein